MRLWHHFASNVLGYLPDETLPPMSSQDVCKFVCIISAAGTAANYVGYINWACTHLRYSCSWNDKPLREMLKGLRKEDWRIRLEQLPDYTKLTEPEMHSLILLAFNMGDADFGVAAVWSYHFLLRVENEAIPLQKGCPSWGRLLRLPADVHSGIWVQDGQLHLRLTSRKHRPRGSYMIRSCCCSQAGDMRVCPVHCL